MAISNAAALCPLLLLLVAQPSLCQPAVLGSYTYLRSISVVGHAVILVPKTNKIAVFNFFQGPEVNENFPGGDLHNFGLLDLTTNAWKPFSKGDGVTINIACAGYAHDSSGNILVYGSHTEMYMYEPNFAAVFKFDIRQQRVYRMPDMAKGRWYSTPLLLPDGTHHVFSGTIDAKKPRVRQNDSDIYTPGTGKTRVVNLPMDLLQSSIGGFYAGMFMLLDGTALVINNLAIQVINPYTGAKLSMAPPQPPLLRKYNIEFPYMGNYVLLPFTTPSAGQPANLQTTYTVILFGGAITKSRASDVACPYARRISVTVGPARGQYRWSDWEWEDTGVPRSTGEAVLLPNGRIVLINGVQVGHGELVPLDPAGWAVNSEPAPPVLYNPYARRGARSYRLAPNSIARMYHSTAHLTASGAIAVTGCSSCSRFNSSRGVRWSPTGSNEFRVELFNPPYLFRAGRPRLLHAPSAARYRTNFWATFSLPAAAPAITSVVLLSSGGTTHSAKANMQAIRLPFYIPDRAAQAGGGAKGVQSRALVDMPPNANWAAPQYYLLYLVSGELYSEGRWIRLVK